MFDSRALVQAWLDVERALAEAEAEVGVIPAAAAERIAAEADASLYDLAELREGIAASKHPLVPLIRALVERCGDEGGWVHWGATTQDIVDTALVLQARAALVPIARDLERSYRAACALALRHRDTPMAGRTHFQHAVPITFGLKAATWADELARCRERLDRAAETASTAQLAGAAGTLATLGERRRSRAGGLQPSGSALPAPTSTGTRRATGCATSGTRSREIACGRRADRGRDRPAAVDRDRRGRRALDGRARRLLDDAAEAQSDDLRVRGRELAARCAARSACSLDSPAHAFERDMGYWAAEWIALPRGAHPRGRQSSTSSPRCSRGWRSTRSACARTSTLSRGQIMAEAVMMALGRIARPRARARARPARVAAGRRRRAATSREVLAEEPEVTRQAHARGARRACSTRPPTSASRPHRWTPSPGKHGRNAVKITGRRADRPASAGRRHEPRGRDPGRVPRSQSTRTRASSAIGEADTSPYLARTIVEMPSSHAVARGLRELLVGEDPLEIGRLWKRLYDGSSYYGRVGRRAARDQRDRHGPLGHRRQGGRACPSRAARRCPRRAGSASTRAR